MNVLVVGDVHGCYHTLKSLVKNNWEPEEEYLIQLGDLINKGPNSVKCLKYFRKLQKKYPDKVVLLRGNHEQMFLDYFQKEKKNRFISELVDQMESADLKASKILKWLKKTPLSWDNEDVFVSHAGIGISTKIPLEEYDPHGVLYNRESLKNIDRLQVTGHNIVEGNKPHFNPKENAWHIDTGAWVKKSLTGLKLKGDASFVKIIREPRHKKDNPSLYSQGLQ